MEPDSTEWLQSPEVVLEAFVGIHKDDKVTCERLGVCLGDCMRALK